ncbi:MAG: hypothetical protein RH860_06975 [Cytophagales bacterium]
MRAFKIASAYLLLVVLLGACMTYYQRYREFNQSFENGNLEQAKKLLEADDKGESRKSRFLYFTNLGVVNSMLSNYEESNAWFEKAYIFGEDYRKNYLNYAASFLTNPKMTVYPGEDHEHLLVPYYKSINYLKQGNFEAALVEARRMDIRLNQFSDKYKSDNKFQEDAFIDLLIGLIYDASKDYNNAFIAYRNAYNTYENEYKTRFGLSAPDQLKKDLLRTAKLSGFYTEVEQYEREFKMKTPEPMATNEGRVLFIWHNGLGPVKDEWAINFVIIKGAGGVVNFQNEELGLNFNFIMSGDDKSSLGDLRTLRVVFPKYVERELLYTDASVQWDGGSSRLFKAEPVNDIARQLLKQRMLKELGESLLRVAIKKAAEQAIRQQSEGAAVAASIINMATEQADTRNWQTLPHSIYYTWLEGEAGKKDLNLKLLSSRFSSYNTQKNISVEFEKGRTKVLTYHSLDVSPRYNPVMDSY